MYQQLAQLIRDGVWLKSYIAAVMRVEQASHMSTVSVVNMPSLRMEVAKTGQRHYASQEVWSRSCSSKRLELPKSS